MAAKGKGPMTKGQLIKHFAEAFGLTRQQTTDFFA